MKDCLFCRIVLGELPAHTVYEDDVVLAFLDIYPKTKGHTLVIPKKHATDVYDIGADTLAHIAKAAQRIALAFERALAPAGVNLLQSSRPAAQQEVLHFHMHVIPRYEDGQNIRFATTYDVQDFEKISGDIAKHI